MAGPALGLWLFEPGSFEDTLLTVVPWLETFCGPIEPGDAGDLTFRVRDVEPLGMEHVDVASACEFDLSNDDYLPGDDDDYSAFPQPPARGLVLAAACSGPANHLLLGHLALSLARRLNALIDFDGVLGYSSPCDEERAAAELSRARELVAALPGRVAEVPYVTARGERWFRHVGDTEFLSAWLEHPDFRLVK